MSVILSETYCLKCQGKGELKKRTVCKNCNGTVCYLCETYGGTKCYEECSDCDGAGAKYFNIKTGKQKYLYALTNYTILKPKTENIVATAQ